MIEEVAHRFDRDGETQTLADVIFMFRHADDFAGEVEQRATAVAGVDLRGRLQVKLAGQLPRLRAQDALSHRALQAQRAADGEYMLPHRQRLGTAKRQRLEFERVLVLDLQQREIGKFVERHNPHCLQVFALKLAALQLFPATL